METLVRLVARAFYDSKAAVVVDLLVADRLIAEDVLADRMRIALKEVARVVAKLREDRLVGLLVRSEHREEDDKAVTRNYLYLDYAQAINVIKWRLWRLRKDLDSRLASHEQAGRGQYRCTGADRLIPQVSTGRPVKRMPGQNAPPPPPMVPLCTRTYTQLDTMRLYDSRRGMFICEACGSEVCEGDAQADQAATVQAQDALGRLMEQTAPLLRLLKQLESVQIPAFDPARELAAREAALASDDSGDFDSEDNEPAKKRSEHGVTVEIVDHDEVQGEHKPTPVAPMPVWQTHSTITGEAVRPATVKDTEAESRPAIEVSLAMGDDYAADYEARILQQIPAKKDAGEKVQVTTNADSGITVTVNGVEKALAEIGDADLEAMTTEEYARYYELMQE